MLVFHPNSELASELDSENSNAVVASGMVRWWLHQLATHHPRVYPSKHSCMASQLWVCSRSGNDLSLSCI
jgi:hypothetical protein